MVFLCGEVAARPVLKASAGLCMGRNALIEKGLYCGCWRDSAGLWRVSQWILVLFSVFFLFLGVSRFPPFFCGFTGQISSCVLGLEAHSESGDATAPV